MAHTFVLACIDPRFTKMLADFLIHEKYVKNDYDLFALAGSELGANDKPKWKAVLKEHIDIALELHDIKEFWVFSHMDCGAYKVFLELEEDNDPHLHESQIKKLYKWIKKHYSQLEFKGFIMGKTGKIVRVC